MLSGPIRWTKTPSRIWNSKKLLGWFSEIVDSFLGKQSGIIDSFWDRYSEIIDSYSEIIDSYSKIIDSFGDIWYYIYIYIWFYNLEILWCYNFNKYIILLFVIVVPFNMLSFKLWEIKILKLLKSPSQILEI